MKPGDVSVIESRFPHVAKGLCESWGKPECQDYLDSLIIDKRGGRQGFPPEVSVELMMLYGIAEIELRQYDVWHEADNRT